MYKQGMLKEGCLKGKTYIVTGGGSGLGKSMTSYLLELGANVLIVSRNEQKLQAATDELKDKCKDDNHIAFQICNVKDSHMIDTTINKAFNKYG